MSPNAASRNGQSSTSDSTKWQESLESTCRERSMRPPTWQLYSDRRGGRTAWTCLVTVEGESYQARNWYDGSHVSNAKEDAAEIALKRLGVSSPSSSQQTGSSSRGGGYGAVGSR